MRLIKDNFIINKPYKLVVVLTGKLQDVQAQTNWKTTNPKWINGYIQAKRLQVMKGSELNRNCRLRATDNAKTTGHRTFHSILDWGTKDMEELHRLWDIIEKLGNSNFFPILVTWISYWVIEFKICTTALWTESNSQYHNGIFEVTSYPKPLYKLDFF